MSMMVMPTMVMIMIMMPMIMMIMMAMMMMMMVIIITTIMMMTSGRCALRWTLDWQRQDSVSTTGGFLILPLLEYFTPS